MADSISAVGTTSVANTTPNTKPQKRPEKIGGVFTEEQLEYLKKIQEESQNDKLSKNQNLGKEQFMHILLKQLANQNPLEPVQDKEFIAQMAQFSSLENMQEMNKSFSGLAKDVGSMKEIIGKLGTRDEELTGIIKKISEQITQINDSIKKQGAGKAYSK